MDLKKRAEAQAEEMLRDKYIASEKAGTDLGERRMVQWTKEHAEAWNVGYNMQHMMDLGDGRKPVYFGIFLNDTSRKALVDAMLPIVPNGWKMFCHHCTIAFGDPSDDREVFMYLANNLGKNVELAVTRIGTSSDALAVEVSGDLVTKNEIAHVTVAVPPDGKPVYSNRIRNWEDYDGLLTLTGVVDAFPSHFGWKH